MSEKQDEEEENAPSEDSMISFYTADTHEPGSQQNPIDIDWFFIRLDIPHLAMSFEEHDQIRLMIEGQLTPLITWSRHSLYLTVESVDCMDISPMVVSDEDRLSARTAEKLATKPPTVSNYDTMKQEIILNYNLASFAVNQGTRSINALHCYTHCSNPLQYQRITHTVDWQLTTPQLLKVSSLWYLNLVRG